MTFHNELSSKFQSPFRLISLLDIPIMSFQQLTSYETYVKPCNWGGSKTIRECLSRDENLKTEFLTTVKILS